MTPSDEARSIPGSGRHRPSYLALAPSPARRRPVSGLRPTSHPLRFPHSGVRSALHLALFFFVLHLAVFFPPLILAPRAPSCTCFFSLLLSDCASWGHPLSLPFPLAFSLSLFCESPRPLLLLSAHVSPCVSFLRLYP